jgi:hypothetical protein
MHEREHGGLWTAILTILAFAFLAFGAVFEFAARQSASSGLDQPEYVLIKDQTPVDFKKGEDFKITEDYNYEAIESIYRSCTFKLYDGQENKSLKHAFVTSCPDLRSYPKPKFIRFNDQQAYIFYEIFENWDSANDWLKKYGFLPVDYKNLKIGDHNELNDQLCRYNQQRRQGVEIMAWNCPTAGFGSMCLLYGKAQEAKGDDLQNIVEMVTGKPSVLKEWTHTSIVWVAIFVGILFCLGPFRMIAVLPVTIYFWHLAFFYNFVLTGMAWLLCLLFDAGSQKKYSLYLIKWTLILGGIAVVVCVLANKAVPFTFENPYAWGLLIGWGLGIFVAGWDLDSTQAWKDFAAIEVIKRL